MSHMDNEQQLRKVIETTRGILNDDGFAASHQSLGQYRSGLLRCISQMMSDLQAGASPVDPSQDIVIDWVADTARIFGIRYSLEIFRTWATAPLGTALEIVGREDGTLTVRRADELKAERDDLRAKVEALTRPATIETDSGRWALYVASMVGGWLGWSIDDERLPIVAGIIDRRIWALRPQTRPAVPDHVSKAQAAVAPGLDVYHRIADRQRAYMLHTDDLAVDRFAAAMKAKLAAARAKGRSGWETCPPDELSRLLREHVDKGDPRDVANFCMMLWHLEASISSNQQVFRWFHLGEGFSAHTDWARSAPHASRHASPDLDEASLRAIRTRALDEFGVGQAQG